MNNGWLERVFRSGAPAAGVTKQARVYMLDVIQMRRSISVEIAASKSIAPRVSQMEDPDRVVVDLPNTVPNMTPA